MCDYTALCVLTASGCVAGRLAQLQTEYSEAVRTVHDQKELITQLEEDLRSVNALSAMLTGFRGDAEVRGSGICSLSFRGDAEVRGSGVLCHVQRGC